MITLTDERLIAALATMGLLFYGVMRRMSVRRHVQLL
jgi:hypothetical protein